MSKDKADKEAKPKQGKGLLIKIILGVALIAAGGGGVLALVETGIIGGKDEKEDNRPRLILKGEEDPYAPKAEGEKEGEGLAEIDGEGGSKYRTSYYSFADDFTSNLKDSESLIQVSLACSTHRDGRVLMWLKKHDLAVRSAMLAVLADTSEADITAIDGKHRLQQRLTTAINKVLNDTEGFGGVDAVYFRSFLIQ